MSTFDNFMEEINTLIKKYYEENAETIIDYIEVDEVGPPSEWPHTKIHIIIPTFEIVVSPDVIPPSRGLPKMYPGDMLSTGPGTTGGRARNDIKVLPWHISRKVHE